MSVCMWDMFIESIVRLDSPGASGGGLKRLETKILSRLSG